MSHTHTIPSSSEYHNPHLNQYEHHNQHSIPPHTRGHADASSPSASSPHPYQQWSPLLRDRQARGKDPYASFADNDDDDDDGYYYNNNNQSGQSHPRLSARAGGAADQDLLRPRQTNFRHGQGLSSRDSYEDRERKEFAMSVLDNPDLLLMHALGNNDVCLLILIHLPCPLSLPGLSVHSVPGHSSFL